MDTVGAVIFLPREGNGNSLMLEDLAFSPAAAWLAETLKSVGIERFFVVCHEDDKAQAAGCFPEGTQIVTSGTRDAAARLSEFLSAGGWALVFTRACFLTAQAAARMTGEAPWLAGPGTGIHRMDALALKTALEEGADLDAALRGGEEYPRTLGGVYPLDAKAGWEDREAVQRAARLASVERLHQAGVRFTDPNAVYIGPAVTVGAGTTVLPGAVLRGKTVIGAGCEIGPNCMITDCTVGDGVTVNASQLMESTVEDGVKIGPFAYIRPNCHVGKGVKVGDFVELKNSTIGEGTKISHLTYVGDSDVGGHVNFGCGTVTVNYDGTSKFRTLIGDDAFIGCNTNLVAPVKVGRGAYTAAGSTITDDVPDDSLAIARSIQINKKQWAAKRRKGKR